MITINVLTVGKLKEKFYRDAVDEYLKRLSRFAKVNVIEVGECMQHSDSDKEIARIVEQESATLLSRIKGYSIALDLSGKMITSPDIASDIKANTDNGANEFTFIIGGSHGLSRGLVDKVDTSYCFGKVTYPHQLMRVILLEQIYRAFMINAGAEYHK